MKKDITGIVFSAISLAITIMAIAMFYGCGEGGNDSDVKVCDGYLAGWQNYTTEPTVGEVWAMSQRVFNRWPYEKFQTQGSVHYCDAIEYENINCSMQATIQEQWGSRFVSDDKTDVCIYSHIDYPFNHVIYCVEIGDELWLFDRNYDWIDLQMPCKESDYISQYHGKVTRVGKSKPLSIIEHYEPFKLE